MVKEPSFLELDSDQGTSEKSSDSSPDSLLQPLHQGQARPQEHKVTISLHNYSLKLEVTLPLGHKAQAEAKLCLGLYPFYSILFRIFIFLPDNFQLLHIIRAEIRNLVLFQTPNKWHNYKYFCNLYALSEQENKRLKSILYIRLLAMAQHSVNVVEQFLSKLTLFHNFELSENQVMITPVVGKRVFIWKSLGTLALGQT